MSKVRTFLIAIAVMSFAHVQAQTGFRFVDDIDKKQIDILFNDKMLTAYCYGDSIMKPVLFPVNTVNGATVTRGFPLASRAGERVDHPHHIGLWFNYESVNGLDFWNNSTAIPYANRSRYGYVEHQKVVKAEAVGKNKATLIVAAQWKNRAGQTLLTEITTYFFEVKKNDFIIDRVTGLTCAVNEVIFKDVKDGLIAIRVARELEHPSTESQTYVDNNGNYTPMPKVDSTGVTGKYLSSSGLTGNDVWGTRGKWVTLSGKIKNRPVSITIIDHPKNPGYPAYWHARGYGLFAANPLGQNIFSKGKEQLNLTLKKDESVIFRYRVVVSDGSLSSEMISKFSKEFSR